MALRDSVITSFHEKQGHRRENPPLIVKSESERHTELTLNARCFPKSKYLFKYRQIYDLPTIFSLDLLGLTSH